MRAGVGERKVRLPLLTRRPAKACSGSGGSQQEFCDVTVGCGRVSGLLRQVAAGRPMAGMVTAPALSVSPIVILVVVRFSR